MPAPPFDTQKVVDQLERSGVPSEQAKAHATVLLEAILAQEHALNQHYFNKQDATREFAALHARLDKMEVSIEKLDTKIDIAYEKLDAKIDKSIAALKGQLIGWVISIGMLQTALISALALKIVH